MLFPFKVAWRRQTYRTCHGEPCFAITSSADPPPSRFFRHGGPLALRCWLEELRRSDAHRDVNAHQRFDSEIRGADQLGGHKQQPAADGDR